MSDGKLFCCDCLPACGALNVLAHFPHHGWVSASDLWGGTYRWDYGDPAPDAYGPLGGAGAPEPFSTALTTLAALTVYQRRPTIFDADGGAHDGGTDCTAAENRWLGLHCEMRALYSWTGLLADVVIDATKSKYTGEILTITATVNGATVRQYELDEASGDVVTDITDDVTPGHPYDIADFYLPGHAQLATEPFGAYIEFNLGLNTASMTAREPSRAGGAGYDYSASLELTDAWTHTDARGVAVAMCEEISLDWPLVPASINGITQQVRLNTNIFLRWIGGTGGQPLTKLVASEHYAGWTDVVPGFSPTEYRDYDYGHDHWPQYFGNFGQRYIISSFFDAEWEVRRCLVADNYVPTCLRTWAYEYCFTIIDVSNPLFPLTVPTYDSRWVVEPGTETSCAQDGVDCVRPFTTGEGRVILEPTDVLFAFGYGHLELSCHSHKAGSFCCYNTKAVNDPTAYSEPYPIGHVCHET